MNWDTLLETGEWITVALLAGAAIAVWGSLALMRLSRPRARVWNGREIV